AAVKVEKSMARSNVTRTLDIVVALGPIGVLLTTCGAVVEATWALPRAAARLRMPPVTTLPCNAVEFFFVARICPMTCLYVQVGFFAPTSAAAPLTNGVAIDVPLRFP